MSKPYPTLPSPCYLLEVEKLRANLELISHVQRESGCNILLALKGFAMWSAFPVVAEYLSGCAVSSYHEARLAREEFGGHVHLYAPAYTMQEFSSLLDLSDRVTFNSLSQWKTFSSQAVKAGVSCGLRVNPRLDEVDVALYNPCAEQSRLGIQLNELDILPDGIEGLHAHALCECDADATERLIDAVENQFGHLLVDIKWLNLGGGHLMTRSGYDVDRLITGLLRFKAKYPHIEVILEPGSAIAWGTGPLVASVLDIVSRGGVEIAILDISATAHMPDVLEMPYRPEVWGAADPGEKAHLYRLGGLTCLAGDVIGDYAFDQPLDVGDQLIFEDMIHYTMVKSTMFNGVEHPAIAILNEDHSVKVVRTFGYEDYKGRLS